MAGLLTAISPCVLPALPLIVGSAVQEHRHAPLAVALGLIFSFTFVGTVLSTLGSSLGIDAEIVRTIGGGALVLASISLLVPRIQDFFQKALSSIGNCAGTTLNRSPGKGLKGQFLVGSLLGLVWSPCVGPTLGAAVGLASQVNTLFLAALMMIVFGIGASLPLLFIAYGSRKLFLEKRSRLMILGQKAKPIFGFLLAVVGIATLTGFDKKAEATLLHVLPQFWVDLITRI
jgi:cytochrome c biogenesis protein CcdA